MRRAPRQQEAGGSWAQSRLSEQKGDDEAVLPIVLRPWDRATPLRASCRLSLTRGRGRGSALKPLISPQAGQGGRPGTPTREPVHLHHRVCPRSLLVLWMLPGLADPEPHFSLGHAAPL